ncbi:PilW family protein, partial [Halomonas sp. MES3-P3E]|uniref:PilW family protein n=1 Tax=Halomonas sp. MES3-P3E TaxID=2058321 RepID=UPI000C325B1C
MSKQWQTGFTLVELMVAMAIGTIIILGAGQLFLTTFQTFQKVDELSRKQETLVFAASSIIERVRNSDNGNSGDSGYSLNCEEVTVGTSQRCDCTIYDAYENGQPILTFEKNINADEGLEASCSGENTNSDISEPSGFNAYL